MVDPAFSTKGSFRVPNSIVQGLTTCTREGLNRLTAFQMVTLLGLMTQVSPKHPEREVRTSVAGILKIIEVSRHVAHAVDREWGTKSGQKRKQKYHNRRFSPAHVERVHEALLVLHEQTVAIRSTGGQKGTVTDRVVHILDSFGYVHQRDGEIVDLDSLLPDQEKINIGSEERPVYRIGRQDSGKSRYERTSGVLFRLNTELAHELSRKRGTIGFTLIAGKVFGVLRQHMRSPAMIRLILLILRQTDDNFIRRLAPQLAGLGWDLSHPRRAARQCETALADLKATGLVLGYTVDHVNDRLSVAVNRDWYRADS